MKSTESQDLKQFKKSLVGKALALGVDLTPELTHQAAAAQHATKIRKLQRLKCKVKKAGMVRLGYLIQRQIDNEEKQRSYDLSKVREFNRELGGLPLKVKAA